jgi:hypothetical protein
MSAGIAASQTVSSAVIAPAGTLVLEVVVAPVNAAAGVAATTAPVTAAVAMDVMPPRTFHAGHFLEIAMLIVAFKNLIAKRFPWKSSLDFNEAMNDLSTRMMKNSTKGGIDPKVRIRVYASELEKLFNMTVEQANKTDQIDMNPLKKQPKQPYVAIRQEGLERIIRGTFFRSEQVQAEAMAIFC